jgi:hypothetical protein
LVASLGHEDWWIRKDAAPDDRGSQDKNGHALAYVYYEEVPGRRSAANLMTKDEARSLRRTSPSCCKTSKNTMVYRRFVASAQQRQAFFRSCQLRNDIAYRSKEVGQASGGIRRHAPQICEGGGRSKLGRSARKGPSSVVLTRHVTQKRITAALTHAAMSETIIVQDAHGKHSVRARPFAAMRRASSVRFMNVMATATSRVATTIR